MRNISKSFTSLFAFTLLSFSIPLSGFSQQLREVNSEVKAVTVFLNRAQVFSAAKTSVPAGQTEIALTNIPASLDVNSIQVEAEGRVTLFGIRYENNYLQRPEKSRELLQAEDSLEFYQNAVRTLNDQNDVYRKEETLMQENQKIGGTKGVIAEDLEDVADLFRKRLFTVRANIMHNDNLLKKQNENVQRFTNLVNDLNSRQRKPNGRILVTVSAENAGPVAFEMSYVVYNAGWQPTYDLRATNTKSPVKLYYKANVYQNTGVNWNNVKLTLTTGNPAIGATKPELQPWYLDFYKPRPVMSGAVMSKKPMNAAPQAAPASMDENFGGSAVAETIADYTQVSEGALDVNFRIGLPYSVPSDGKRHLVEIQNYDMKASYTYAAVPKYAPEAFLMARVSGWEDYNILPGEANIFMEGTFTGKTTLNPQATGDTLPVSLGRDKRVILSREKVKEFKSKSFLGGNRKETLGYLISVRNTKDQPIDLLVEDQIPVSNNGQIEVEMLDNGGGKLDKNTGKITWQLKLKANETLKLPLKFEVKYPKNQQIPGL